MRHTAKAVQNKKVRGDKHADMGGECVTMIDASSQEERVSACKKMKKNVQYQGFARGHPPYY